MLYLLLGDHLGSTAYTVSGTTELGEVRYKAFGATRFTSGTTPTSYRYTGQREESGLGLYYYGARWYDPSLGHFIQPDTLVPDPGHAPDYHRYGYTRFNPLKYNDPTGHCSLVAAGASVMRADIGFCAGGIANEQSGGGGAVLMAGGMTAVAAGYLIGQVAQDLREYVTPESGPAGSTVHGDPLPVAEMQVYAQPLGSDQEVGITIPGTSADSTLQIGNVIAEPLPEIDPTGHIYTSQNDHEVYIVRNPRTGEVVIYVGRTSQGITTREKQHREIPGREGWDLDLVQDGLSLDQARELEQELIIRYGLNNLENRRNEIAPSKWSDRLKGLFQRQQGDQ